MSRQVGEEVPKLSRVVFQIQPGTFLRLHMEDGTELEGQFIKWDEQILEINADRMGKVSVVMSDVDKLWKFGRDDPRSPLWGAETGGKGNRTELTAIEE